MKHRRDSNHAQIMRDLRKMGYSLQDTSQIGDGFGDAVMARGRNTAILEIKSPKGSRSALECRSASQRKFARGWQGVIICAFSAVSADMAFFEEFYGR